MTARPVFATAVLYVDDVAAIVDYYRLALAIEPTHYDAELGFALLGEEQSIAICSHAAGRLMMEDGYRATAGERVARAELAFWADDVDAAFRRAVAAGGVPLTPPRTMPWGQTVAYVGAPEGTILGFLTPVDAQSAG